MAYLYYLERLSRRYERGEARFIFRLICEKLLSLSWTQVICGATENLFPEEKELLENAVLRVEAGEPVQYVLGTGDFLGREFIVSPAVLIPRPETECLVREALEYAGKKEVKSGSRILDIGTGSGCVGISLALELPDSEVEAWDISDEALEVARANAERFGATNIRFCKADALSAAKEQRLLERRFSIIVSNPPYVRESERKDMEEHVFAHEPSLALFVPDNDPLLFYRNIVNYSKTALQANGLLAFEANREFCPEIEQLLEDGGFSDIKTIKDQYENPRIVKGTKL